MLKQIDHQRISLVAVGWHGRFLTGRARILTPLIQTIAIPVLLVQPGRRTTLTLKVGEEIE